MANEIKGIFDYIREGLGEQISPLGSAYSKFLELPPELRQGLISQDTRESVANMKPAPYDTQEGGFQGVMGGSQIGGQELISSSDPTDYGRAGGENLGSADKYVAETLLGTADILAQPDVIGKELLDIGGGLIQKSQGIEGTEQVKKAEGLIDAVKNFDFNKSLYEGGGAVDLALGGMAVAPFVAKKLKGLPAGMSVTDISKEAPTNEGYFMRSTDVLLNDPKFAGKEAIAPQSLITVKKDGDVAGELRNSGVSVQEMKEIGLIDFIEQKRAEGVKKIPKQELIDFIEENKPTVAPTYVTWADQEGFSEDFDQSFMSAFDVYGEGTPTAYIDYDLQELRPSNNFYSGYYDGVEVRAIDNENPWKFEYKKEKINHQQKLFATEGEFKGGQNPFVRDAIERDLTDFYHWTVRKYNSRPEDNPYSVRETRPEIMDNPDVYLNRQFKEQAINNGGLWSFTNDLDKIVPNFKEDISEYLDDIWKKNGKEYEWKMGDYVISGKPTGNKKLEKITGEVDGMQVRSNIGTYGDIESLEGAIKNRLQQDAGVILPKYGTYTASGKSSGYEEIPVVVSKKDYRGFEESGLSNEEAFSFGRIHPLGTDEPYLFHLRSSTRKDLSGNKFYYIEELQSDWHQKGRARGFIDSKKVKEAEEILKSPDYETKKADYYALKRQANRIDNDIWDNYSHLTYSYANPKTNLNDLMDAYNNYGVNKKYYTDYLHEALSDAEDILPADLKYPKLNEMSFQQILKRVDELPRDLGDEILEFNKMLNADPDVRAQLDDVLELQDAQNQLHKKMKPLEKYASAQKTVDQQYPTKTPPFAKELWSKVGLRQGLTRAIDKGLDKVAWTNADIQTKIYSPDYLKLYQNTYEKNMPKQARELLKELGVDPDKHLKKTKFDMEDMGEQEVWYIDITPELKSKLIDMQGNVRQPLYSSIGGAGIGGGLLATDPSNSDNINPNKGILA